MPRRHNRTSAAEPDVGAPERFDGWVVVAAVFLLFVTNAGLGFYGLAIYLEAVTDEQGFSTSSVSAATSLFFVTSAVVGRLIAAPVERGQIRALVLAGGAISGTALALLGQVEEVWQLYVVYLFFASGFALAGIIPGTTLVTRWFHERRSVALAVASSGLSVGGLTLTQLSSWWIGTAGLATATPWLGATLVVLTGTAAMFLWPDPESRGQRPDGAGASDPDRARAGAFGGARRSPAGVPYAIAVRSRFFWAVTVGFFFAMAAQVGSIAHLANLGTERFDRSTGALAVLFLALASVVFRLLGGVVATKIPLAGMAVVLAALQGLSQIVLAEAGTSVVLLLAAALMGATVGNLLMLQTLLVAEAFGVVAYARLFSLNQLVITLGLAGGPLLLGTLEDGSGYRLAYWAAAVLSLTGAAVFSSGGSVARAGGG